MWTRRIVPLVLISLAGLLPGCSSEEPANPDLVPVTGLVTYRGAPVADAIVTFRAADNSTSAFGQTNAEGIYRLTTKQTNDGALPGNYLVTVEKMATDSAGQLPEDHPDYGKAPIVDSRPRSLLPPKFAAPMSSGLQATVTADGDNDIPLQLTD